MDPLAEAPSLREAMSLRVRKIMKCLLNFYSSLWQRYQNTTVKSGSRLESGGLGGGNCEVFRQGGMNKWRDKGGK